MDDIRLKESLIDEDFEDFLNNSFKCSQNIDKLLKEIHNDEEK